MTGVGRARAYTPDPMDGITLRYAIRRTERTPDQEPEVTRGELLIGLTESTIIVDEETSVRFVDFERRRTAVLDRGAGTVREGSLVGYAHDRVAGLGSMLHAISVASAGGVETETSSQAEALYGLSWPKDGDPETAFERRATEDGSSWWVDGREVVSATPTATPPDMSSRGMARLFAFALRLHPQIATELASEGVVPQVLVTDNASLLFSQHEVREYTLLSVALGSPDFVSVAAESSPTPSADALLGLIGTQRTDRSPSFRLDDAHAALAQGNRLEALLAVLAHNWAHVDQTGPLVASIFERAGWLSPLKKFNENLAHADTKPGIESQIQKLEKLRRKGGRYAYALDVIIGEKFAAMDEQLKAREFFGRALQQDPGLAATWISAGRTYPGELRFQDAWDCFDEGDRLCPQHKVVGDTHMLSTQLRADHPQLF